MSTALVVHRDVGVGMGTAMIVDGQNLLMRAIFASKGSNMSSGGTLTGPLLIFINSLAKHVQQERPERLVVTWDGGTSQARRDRLPSYKASRKVVPEEEAEDRDSSHGLVRRFLALAGASQILLRGVEADDLIAGAWATMAEPEIGKIVILSSDKDFLQLVGVNPHGIETELVRLSSAGTPTDRWDARRVIDAHGYRPEQWPLMTALTGDVSDGVPGLRGVGPVKALKLLEAHRWRLDLLPVPVEDRETAQACFDVVNLRGITMPVGVPPWRPTRQDSMLWPDLIEFLSSLELMSVKDRLQAGELWSIRDLTTATQRDDTPNGRP